MKHGPHYDDPWLYSYEPKEARKGKPVLVYDTKTGKIDEWKTRNDFCEHALIERGAIDGAIGHMRLCADRYLFGNTIAQLFRAMATYNYS
jgi:hypothetical protein